MPTSAMASSCPAKFPTTFAPAPRCDHPGFLSLAAPRPPAAGRSLLPPAARGEGWGEGLSLEKPSMTPLPLNDFRAIDLTAHRAGPTAVRQLADWGARASRTNPPGSRGEPPGTGRKDPVSKTLHPTS